jgi:hypothetical protein
LETEKELQAGGEVKELTEEVDALAMKCARRRPFLLFFLFGAFGRGWVGCLCLF